MKISYAEWMAQNPTGSVEEYNMYSNAGTGLLDNYMAGNMGTGNVDSFAGIEDTGIGADTGLFDNWSGKDMTMAGMGIAQTGLGLANYDMNRSYNRKRKQALSENITASKEARARKTQSYNQTTSAFK